MNTNNETINKIAQLSEAVGKEYFRTVRHKDAIELEKAKIDGEVEKKKIQMEHLKNLTPEERHMLDLEHYNTYVANEITKWSFCRCSGFCNRKNRQKIESTLIAMTALRRPELVQDLHHVFANPNCGRPDQLYHVHAFLSKLRKPE